MSMCYKMHLREIVVRPLRVLAGVNSSETGFVKCIYVKSLLFGPHSSETGVNSAENAFTRNRCLAEFDAIDKHVAVFLQHLFFYLELSEK